ncbi:helix-turn-helix domain-containing protein [Empedobacter falsenii]|uniref:helix-turn-helix domain-containing protein n=1 Tax=Empedobacter falsenii TaxID=343874 RepID=UPI001C55F0F1|nr:helix-turn-helix transcriptional regulator [Empedobacter falsenii]MBW1619376.1 helix-turn-helix transcriptional regulator [Empedobacter falsenii]
MKAKCLETLRKVRREKNFSQDYMAEKLKITQKAYSDIENGKTTLKNDIVVKLANILDLSPDDLCTISNSCGNIHKLKNEELLKLLTQNNIDIPDHLL